ncbi:hypothetical protein M6B38_390920 [Iris pallida]|uniref:Uncharacterized protein n=1 Tax=Iris pallida TaxID=29817 RepID=A0AAX6G0A5_IRIPA|nr:hypothetical protein M6B38_390920 [Iris pallida]
MKLRDRVENCLQAAKLRDMISQRPGMNIKNAGGPQCRLRGSKGAALTPPVADGRSGVVISLRTWIENFGWPIFKRTMLLGRGLV